MSKENIRNMVIDKIPLNDLLKGVSGSYFYGIFGLLVEPVVKKLTPENIAQINNWFLDYGIKSDALILHDQLTDLLWAASAGFCLNMSLKIMSNESKENSRLNQFVQKYSIPLTVIGVEATIAAFELYSRFVEPGAKTFAEAYDIFVKTISSGKIPIDERDMIATTVGLTAFAATTILWNAKEANKSLEVKS